MKSYRQGDILLVEREKIDEEELKKMEAVQPDDNAMVLAYGEVTGHKHSFRDDLESVALYKDPTKKTRHLRLVKPQALKHEEHAPIEIPPGDYDVIQQNEWVEEDVRPVLD